MVWYCGGVCGSVCRCSAVRVWCCDRTQHTRDSPTTDVVYHAHRHMNSLTPHYTTLHYAHMPTCAHNHTTSPFAAPHHAATSTCQPHAHHTTHTHRVHTGCMSMLKRRKSVHVRSAELPYHQMEKHHLFCKALKRWGVPPSDCYDVTTLCSNVNKPNAGNEVWCHAMLCNVWRCVV